MIIKLIFQRNMKFRKITVEANQSLTDVAVQYYGTADAVRWLIEDNDNIAGYNAVMVAGEQVRIRDEASRAVESRLDDAAITRLIKRDGVKIATGENVESLLSNPNSRGNNIGLFIFGGNLQIH